MKALLLAAATLFSPIAFAVPSADIKVGMDDQHSEQRQK